MLRFFKLFCVSVILLLTSGCKTIERSEQCVWFLEDNWLLEDDKELKNRLVNMTGYRKGRYKRSQARSFLFSKESENVTVNSNTQNAASAKGENVTKVKHYGICFVLKYSTKAHRKECGNTYVTFEKQGDWKKQSMDRSIVCDG